MATVKNGLTDIPGILVGHVTDSKALTGCTAILCEAGAAAGYDIRGSATGTEEFEVMSPLHLTPVIHAVTLAGGSAFGLVAVLGVRRYLESKGIGFETGSARVPLAPAAIIYDLGVGDPTVRPRLETGEAAAAAATDGPVEEGAVGAGTGATVGKLRGMDCAMKSGIGTASVALGGEYEGVRAAALAVVNAFGDVRDWRTGELIAGTRRAPNSEELLDTAEEMKRGVRGDTRSGVNTTLVVVATNARLSKVGATKLAQIAGIGVARSISPVWTTMDGDVTIALSLGTATADINVVGVAAAEAVSEAIVRAVRMAPTVGGVPGLAG
jgi:L-aminopeptidase/D-esterase-like protein